MSHSAPSRSAAPGRTDPSGGNEALCRNSATGWNDPSGGTKTTNHVEPTATIITRPTPPTSSSSKKRPRGHKKGNPPAKKRITANHLITEFLKQAPPKPIHPKPRTETPKHTTTNGANTQTDQASLRHPTPAPRSFQRLATKTTPSRTTSHKTTPATSNSNTPSSSGCDMIYTNLQHKRAALATLAINITNNQTPIIFITEPYCDRNNNIPNLHKDMFTFQPLDRTERPRAAIAIHKEFVPMTTELTELSNRDTTTIMITINKTKHILSCIYSDINNKVDIITSTLENISTTANKLQASLIINADANAHNVMWGDKRSDPKGDHIIKTTTDLDLDIINRGASPTFLNSRNQQSCIDITIANRKGSNLIENWHVSNQFTNSDHKYIRAKINFDTQVHTKFKTDKNTNWNNFREQLNKSKELRTIRNFTPRNKKELDEHTVRINDIILKAWDTNTPYTYKTNRIKPPTWQNEDIKKLINTTRDKLSKHRKHRNDASLSELKEANAALNKMIRQSKNAKWKEFTKSIEGAAETARIHKICNNHGKTRKNLDSIFKPNGKLTTTPQETLQIMKSAHYGDDQKEKTPPSLYADTKTPLKFNLKQVHRAIASLKPNKAAGPDNITPNMIREAKDALAGPLLTVMQASYELGYTPSPWKISKGIFIPKPGKADYRDPKAFRTITLAPILLKVMERLIYWDLENNNIDSKLSEKQFGFRKSSSTEAALHKLTHKIEKRIKKQQYALAVFLDIEGAFDKVSFKAIQNALLEKGINPKTVNWIMNMTTTRSLITEHKGTTLTFAINKGVAQGGILSPLIWNLVIDDLLSATASQSPSYIQAFADDIVSLAEGKDITILRHRTYKTLTHINKWCKEHGLKLSTIKTTLIMFTNKRNWTLKPIKIEGETIKASNHTKFLGVTIDSKLQYKEHIKNITQRAKCNLHRATMAIGPTWGLTPKAVLWVYRQIIRPAMTYASPIWVSALANKHNRRTLRTVQALALRIATGALPKTAHSDLNMITDSTDIVYFIEKSSTLTTARLKCTRHWTKETINQPNTHTQRCNELWSELHLPDYPLDKIKQRTQHSNFTCILDHKDGLKNAESPNAITIYTDGSKNSNNQTGIGAFSQHHLFKLNLSENLPVHSTVYQAELTAIRRAAEETIKLNISDTQIHIRTDSKAAIQSLNSDTISSLTLNKCKEVLNELGRNNDVTIKWVKAHIGITGNEEADQLAKMGCLLATPHTTSPIPISYIKTRAKKRATTLTYETFAKEGGKAARGLANNPKFWTNIKRQMWLIRKNRKRFRLAVQIITSIGPFNYYLHKIGKASSKRCPLCEEEDETVDHIIRKCSALAETRFRLGIYNPLESLGKMISSKLLTCIKTMEQATRMKQRLREAQENTA